MIGSISIRAALVAALAVVLWTPALASAATATCSVSGLRAARTQGSVTYSVAVQALRARSATCTRARHIAHVAATAALAGRALPRKIDGFKITSRKPCGGCSPITPVTATRGSARVTFKLAGGA